jgi:hypothetical protein
MQRQVGTASQIVQMFILNSMSTSGGGLTGLAYNTSGLTCYYKRNTASASVSVSLATMTLGTWATCGFKEVNSTNMPGLYEVGIPNAALASGADLVTIYFNGAANMVPLPIQIELTATSNQDGVRGGMTAIPAAPMMVKKDQALNNFAFLLVSSTDHVTPKTGATVTATRSIDGGAFAACANSPTEVGSGLYVIDLANTDLNGGVITFAFTATGADQRTITVIPQP